MQRREMPKISLLSWWLKAMWLVISRSSIGQQSSISRILSYLGTIFFSIGELYKQVMGHEVFEVRSAILHQFLPKYQLLHSKGSWRSLTEFCQKPQLNVTHLGDFLSWRPNTTQTHTPNLSLINDLKTTWRYWIRDNLFNWLQLRPERTPI